MDDGQVMGYPLLGWMIALAWIMAAWMAAVAVWIIRTQLQWRRLRQDLIETIRGRKKRITLQSSEENSNRESVHIKSGRGKEGLTAKSTSQSTSVRVRVEESTSAGSSQVRENSHA